MTPSWGTSEHPDAASLPPFGAAQLETADESARSERHGEGLPGMWTAAMIKLRRRLARWIDVPRPRRTPHSSFGLR